MKITWNKLEFKTRNYILIFVTGFVISYVQMSIHDKKSFWGTFREFAGDFFVSYFFLVIFLLISYVIIKITGKYFLPNGVNDNTDITEITFYVCMALIILCVLSFILGIRISFQY
jgi:hypothetical protein